MASKYISSLMQMGMSNTQIEGALGALAGSFIKNKTQAQQWANAAVQAAEQVQRALDGVHSKTVMLNVITNAVSGGGSVVPGVSSPAALRARGYASGTSGAADGWAWVGEAGPELVRFRGGETVVPSRMAQGYANGAGDVGGDIHVHAYIDGRKVYSSVQKRAVNTQRRTGANGFTKRSR
jgi:phage-related tail protein